MVNAIGLEALTSRLLDLGWGKVFTVKAPSPLRIDFKLSNNYKIKRLT